MSPELVNQIVQSVLQELRRRRTAQAPTVQSDPSPMCDLRDYSVVTETLLEKAAVGSGSITVDPTAVMTPSARDFLKRHKTRVMTTTGKGHSQHTEPSVVAAGTGRLFITDILPEAAEQLAAGAGWQTFRVTKPDEAPALIRQQSETMVVAAVRCPSAVACELNRDPTYRAAVLTQATNLSALGRVMHPNVICIDAEEGWSISELHQLLRQISRAGRDA